MVRRLTKSEETDREPSQAVSENFAPSMPKHLVPLAGDWALWRDFALRSAGFPVSGLAALGGDDEAARLRAIAGDPLFREAVTWQNRGALRSAVDRLAGTELLSPGQARRAEEVVAGYWQRYCAKNDTIGFFGPLAWGRIEGGGPAVSLQSRGLVATRSLHFETWCIEALAKTVDGSLSIPMSPYPERELRLQLERRSDRTAEYGLVALEQLEAAGKAVAAAPPEHLAAALANLDAVFERLTGRSAIRRPDDAEGGLTPVYLDCMRDVDLSLGPALTREFTNGLRAMFESSRWHCGRVYETACDLLAEMVGTVRGEPLEPRLGELWSALTQLPARLGEQTVELQRRWKDLLAGDPDTLGPRAAQRFSDHRSAWPSSVYQSVDIQVAAPGIDAINAGHFTAVLGDFHAGTNPLGQGMFANRHPDRQRFLSDLASDVGFPQFLLGPPPGPWFHPTSRLFMAFTRPDDIHVTVSGQRGWPHGYRSVPIDELLIDGANVTDSAESFTTPLAHLLFLPIFFSAMVSFRPFPAIEHAPRLTVGRTVLRRETWHLPAKAMPGNADQLAAWARGYGMPRRIFVRSPLEPKPIYVDTASQALARMLVRQLRRAADAVPQALVSITEMLPAADDCWLRHDGVSYTSELRIVAVDLTRRPPSTKESSA
jgi:Lantibiotic dehydratase, N terminus